MSVVEGHAKLKRAAKDLGARWSEIKLSWRDDISHQFEENHVVDLMHKARTAGEALSRMAMILEKARRDCG
jgi:hypothetical protein